MTDVQPPTDEDVAKWTAAIHEIMERDGVTEEEANTGLVAVLLSPEVQEQIKILQEEADANIERDEELWAAVISELMSRFPQWTEQEANDNLIALLKWVEGHPGEDL